MNTKNRILSLVAASALGLTLASCSNGGDETPATEGGGNAAETEQTGSTDDAADDEGAEDTDAAAVATGPECLLGTWEMTPEAIEQQVLAQTGGEGEVEADGTSTMTFDGETATTDVDVTSSYEISVAGTTTTGANDTDSTVVVSYTADEESFTYGEVVSAEGTVSVTVNDTTQEVGAAESASMLAGQVYTYTCSETELTLTTTIPVLDVELVQTLTRA